MTIKVLSDTALLIELARQPDSGVRRQVRALMSLVEGLGWPEVSEIVPAATSLAIYIKRTGKWLVVAARLEEVLSGELTGGPSDTPEREKTIEVCYRGESAPDLDRVSQAVGLSPEEIIKRHTAPTYTVLAIGFAPGFPYLAGLDPRLHCPRLPTPRVSVPRGSVGIGGEQTGIYPLELPGGWNLIGRTHQSLFDAEAVEPAWLQVGDQVRFEAVEALPDARPNSKPPRTIHSTPPEDIAGVEVMDGGAQTTVQDLGRHSYLALGVTESGAVNRRALRIANLLVGNDDNAAALEWVMRGPKLRFHDTRLVVITGTLVRQVPFARPFVVTAGTVLDLTKLTEAGRGILAISGGLAVRQVLGSGATHLSGRFGGWEGRAVRPGDLLPLLPPRAKAATAGWRILPTWVGGAAEPVAAIRVIKGPEAANFGPTGWDGLLGQAWEIRSDSNRMGIRLAGEEVLPEEKLEMVSQPVATGTIQVPPGGQPIVLMVDRQTLGGYPRIASVVTVDLAVLAQVPLGGRIRFVETTLAEAEEMRLGEERELGLLKAALSSRLDFAV